jgi:hypothetical protein
MNDLGASSGLTEMALCCLHTYARIRSVRKKSATALCQPTANERPLDRPMLSRMEDLRLTLSLSRLTSWFGKSEGMIPTPIVCGEASKEPSVFQVSKVPMKLICPRSHSVAGIRLKVLKRVLSTRSLVVGE